MRNVLSSGHTLSGSVLPLFSGQDQRFLSKYFHSCVSMCHRLCILFCLVVKFTQDKIHRLNHFKAYNSVSFVLCNVGQPSPLPRSRTLHYSERRPLKPSYPLGERRLFVLFLINVTHTGAQPCAGYRRGAPRLELTLCGNSGTTPSSQ